MTSNPWITSLMWGSLNGRLGLLTAVWLQTNVQECELGLRPRLYAGSVCDDSTAEAAYATIIIVP